nr:YwiC-like family protein [uncultured Bacillus sp.]
MKLFLPKQHGAWAMLIIPYWLGVAASDFLWQHIPFFIGWILLYLGTYPFLLLFKGKKISFYSKWTLLYMIPGVLLLFIPLLSRPSIIWFGLLMLPLFSLNICFSYKNNDRALMNDILAILIFSIVGLASSYLAKGSIGSLDLRIFIVNILFFIGCTFYVKTMIREKKNQVYKWISFSYHVLVPFILFACHEWMAAIALLPSLFRAVFFYGKTYSVKKIGILEIVNAALFFFIMLTSIMTAS